MKQLKIQMFGDFTLIYNDEILTENSNRSRKPWLFMEYLISKNGKDISQEELACVLWERKNRVDIYGALKTQMHRLRQFLKGINIGDAETLIVTKGGTYNFSPSIPFSIDTNEFENYIKQTEKPGITEKEKVKYLRLAISLYKNVYLNKQQGIKWVCELREYYHKKWLSAIHSLCDILLKYKQYTDLIETCKNAMKIDSEDIEIQKAFIMARARSGDNKGSLEYWSEIANQRYIKKGLPPPADFYAVYEEIKNTDESYEPDILEIQSQLYEEPEHLEGAYKCEYDIFKHIYRLQLRESARTNTAVQLGLFTVKNNEGKIPEQSILQKSMQCLSSCIAKSLRQSDVYTRYSKGQYLVMVITGNNVQGENIFRRILSHYKQDCKTENIVISVNLQKSIIEGQ